MPTESPSHLPSNIIRTAIGWMLRVRADAAAAPACEAWQRQHADHALAWQRVSRLDTELEGGFRASALTAGPMAATLERTAERLQQRRRLLKLLSMAVVSAPVAWQTRELAVTQGLLADVSTPVGERQRLTLADGSLLALDTDSAVDLRFDAQQRLVVVLRGQIRLVSGADPGALQRRPLRVLTRDGLFEAVGTQFTVRLHPDSTQLDVQQGAVRAEPDAAPQAAMLVAAGESAFMRHGQLQLAAAAPALTPDGWVDGVLDVRDMRLADFIAEVARYRHGRMSCDRSVAELRVSGVFQLDDIDGLLAIVARNLSVAIERRTRWWLRLVPAEKAGGGRPAVGF